MTPLLSVDAVEEHDDDEKSPCGLCKKPVAVLYKVRLDDGARLTVCRSDLHRILTMKAEARKATTEAEPLFTIGNDRAK